MTYPTVPAGLTHASILADHDFETVSEAGYVWREGTQKWAMLDNCSKYGLAAVGSAVYAEHPSTEVISYAYDLKDGRGARIWIPDCAPPLDLFDHIARGELLEAWNTCFEFLIWNLVCTRRYGWPALPLEQTRCAMAKARAFGLPGGLDKASDVVGSVRKDKALGDRVIKRYSVPRNPTAKDKRLRIRPSEDGIAAADLYHYNALDIQAEAAVSHVTPDLSDFEQQVWLLDQRINLRGVPIDMPLVHKALAVLEYMEKRHDEELRAVSDGHLRTYTEVSAMQKYLYEFWGLSSHSLDEEAIEEIFKQNPRLHPQPRRVLEIRQIMSSAGVKKLHAMTRLASGDQRIRQLYMYHSAHTGRWAAGGIQPHNMKSSGPSLSWCNRCKLYYSTTDFDTCRWCRENDTVPGKEWGFGVMDRSLDFIGHERTTPEEVHHLLGKDTLPVLAASIRGMIRAPQGREFVCSDYSAIEAVGLAMLSGEQWRIDVFRTHGKIYEASISKTTGVTLEEMAAYRKLHERHHPLRKKGKTRELAGGYGGFVGAWKQFGADEFMSDDEIKADVLAWRADSPMIVELWGGQWRKHPTRWEFTHEFFGLEGAAVQAVLRKGIWFTYREAGFLCWNDVLYMRLPSGRCIAYHSPQLSEQEDRFSKQPIWRLSYLGYNTNPKNGQMNVWLRMEVTGGSLTNNYVQATCRDIFAHGMLNVEAGGYPIVLHTHDELIAEVPEGYGSVEEFEALMVKPAPWYADWPVRAADGWRGKRYRKD